MRLLIFRSDEWGGLGGREPRRTAFAVSLPAQNPSHCETLVLDAAAQVAQELQAAALVLAYQVLADRQ